MWIKGNNYTINLDMVKEIEWDDAKETIDLDEKRIEFTTHDKYSQTLDLILNSIGSVWNLP